MHNGREFLKMIIITSINYNDESTDGRHKNDHDLSYYQPTSDHDMEKTHCDFITYYKVANNDTYGPLLDAIVTILSNRNVITDTDAFNGVVLDENNAINSINATLIKHGHICYIDYVSYNDNNVITYKINKKKSGLIIPDIGTRLDQKYTYVFSTLLNNKFSYKLLTKLD